MAYLFQILQCIFSKNVNILLSNLTAGFSLSPFNIATAHLCSLVSAVQLFNRPKMTLTKILFLLQYKIPSTIMQHIPLSYFFHVLSSFYSYLFFHNTHIFEEYSFYIKIEYPSFQACWLFYHDQTHSVQSWLEKHMGKLCLLDAISGSICMVILILNKKATRQN